MSLVHLSAVELRRRIGNKDISPVELLEACIARIEAVNPAVNAICATDYPRARATAREAEVQVLRGEPLGALHARLKARPVRGPSAVFVAAMDDDFNTSVAVAELQSLARAVNTAKAAGRADEAAVASLPLCLERFELPGRDAHQHGRAVGLFARRAGRAQCPHIQGFADGYHRPAFCR